MIFRIYWEPMGGHVHMRVFAGKQECGLGKCGDLTMRVDEFEQFRIATWDAHSASTIDFRPESPVDRTRSAHDKEGNRHDQHTVHTDGR